MNESVTVLALVVLDSVLVVFAFLLVGGVARSVRQLTDRMNGLAQTFQSFSKLKEAIMKTLADLTQEVSDVKTLAESLVTLTYGIKSKLDAALAAVGGLNPTQQAAVDGVFGELDQAKADIAKALTDNTPAADVPVDQPGDQPLPPAPAPAPAPAATKPVITSASNGSASGTADPNASVTLTSDMGGVNSVQVADANGNWSISFPALSAGTYALTATVNGVASDPSSLVVS